jgi:hypothetical protein
VRGFGGNPDNHYEELDMDRPRMKLTPERVAKHRNFLLSKRKMMERMRG